MNVLIVGGGGREHAIVWALSKSEQVEQLYCAPGNGGIAALAQCVPLSATDVDGVVAWAQTHSIDLWWWRRTIPSPWAWWMPWRMRAFPPSAPGRTPPSSSQQNLFQESDGQVPHSNRKYQTFTELAPALAYIEAEGAPIVVKADGLALARALSWPRR